MWGLEQWLCSSKHLVLLQRIRVQFPVPMMSSSQPFVLQLQGLGVISSLGHWKPLASVDTCTPIECTYTQRHAYLQIKINLKENSVYETDHSIYFLFKKYIIGFLCAHIPHSSFVTELWSPFALEIHTFGWLSNIAFRSYVLPLTEIIFQGTLIRTYYRLVIWQIGLMKVREQCELVRWPSG